MKKQKHLFLEGPIQEGKSTLIRKFIGDDLAQVGGFSSQRLLNDSGETVGFRIVPAMEAMELTKKYSPELSHVFLHFDGANIKKTPKVFADTARKYLRESDGKKIILLDEIGGMELMMPEFRQELYRILEGEIPCFGVLKLESSNLHMCSNAGISRDCIDYHLQLREHLIHDCDAEMIRFERRSAESVEKAMKAFTNSIGFPSGSSDRHCI